MGLPVVNARGPIMVGDRPALVYDRFEAGTKDAVKVIRGRVTVVGDLGVLNGKSIADLMLIKEKLLNAEIKIKDLQFLVNRDGGVVISDPMGVERGYKKENMKMIDLLIEMTRNMGKR